MAQWFGLKVLVFELYEDPLVKDSIDFSKWQLQAELGHRVDDNYYGFSVFPAAVHYVLSAIL